MSNVMAPKVTVLMTLYNKGPFVEEAMRSVLHGSFTDLELLIVDDASTDDGPARVRAMNDPRIRLLAGERNQGRAATANRGYDAAQGTYIAILDADDIAHPDRLARQVAFLDAHPEVGVCGAFAARFGAEEKIDRWPADDAACRARILFSDPVLYGVSMFRTALVRDHGIRSRSDWTLPGEDYLFLLELGRHARFANLQEVLLRYRIGPQNQRHGRDAYEDRKAICREVFRHFGIPVDEEQLELHMLFYLLTKTPVTADRVRRFHAWGRQLEGLVRERGLFPAELFHAELEHRRRRAFFLFADHGPAAAWAHMRCSGGLSPSQARYLLQVTIRRFLGVGNRT